MDKYHDIHLWLDGEFVHAPNLTYKGGRLHHFTKINLDYFSEFELHDLYDKAGGKWLNREFYWLYPGKSLQTGLRSIGHTWDIVDMANAHYNLGEITLFAKQIEDPIQAIDAEGNKIPKKMDDPHKSIKYLLAGVNFTDDEDDAVGGQNEPMVTQEEPVITQDEHVTTHEEAGMWQLCGYPCNHACSAIGQMRLKMEDFVHSWYKKETYLKSYAHIIHAVPGKRHYIQTESVPLAPPAFKRKMGRPKKLRRKGPDELQRVSTRKGLTTTCSKCLRHGHNKKTCTNQPHPNSKLYKGTTAHQNTSQSTHAATPQMNAISDSNRSETVAPQHSQDASTHTGVINRILEFSTKGEEMQICWAQNLHHQPHISLICPQPQLRGLPILHKLPHLCKDKHLELKLQENKG